MEDSTSPTNPNTVPKVNWPEVAVPGQGVPGRRGDEHSADAVSGDRPLDASRPLSARTTVPISNSVGDVQVSGIGTPTGTGPQDSGVAPGDRSGDRDTGRHLSPGTDVPGEPTEQQEIAATDGGTRAGGHEGAGAQVAADGVALLDELRAAIGKYVVLPNEEALTAVTLWVAATHIQTALQHAPRLAVVSPTKGCGKSRVLDVLHETVYQPMMTVNTSPAVIFRVIGKNPPTLLVDEADTIFGPKASGDSEILRGLLNAGHQRNRPAWRISGPDHKPTPFPTFAMAAIAGIGDLPDTVMDRAVVLRMQKRKPGEKVTPFRSRYSVPELNALRDRLTAWLGPLRGQAARIVPQMPVEDRAADTWEPLVIIADLAGGQWPAQARAACLAMTRHEAAQDEQSSLKTRLLRDIHRIFAQADNPEALATQDLVASLLQDAEAPWAEYGTKGLNAYHLSNLLRDFNISPANYRFDKGRQAKAYMRNRFLDAWARNCPDLVEAAPESERGAAPAHMPQGRPPAAPAGTLPVGPPGGPAGPKRAL
ncbi:hypothetical protein GCM10022285_35370 [Streptomyces tunisiensis]|uniref:DUF3631 domain-containing protein n=1 Tax=Streptomyces tunisiensis TaxID=948699 RepID=A0ABP7YM51_9ACTN